MASAEKGTGVEFNPVVAVAGDIGAVVLGGGLDAREENNTYFGTGLKSAPAPAAEVLPPLS
jgi:hypothetical protein